MTGDKKDKVAEKDFPNKARMTAKVMHKQLGGVNPNAAKYIAGRSAAMIKKDAVVGEAVEYADQLIREYCK